MEAVDSPFCPLPRVAGGQRIPGYQFPWPRTCDNCDRQCESSNITSLSVCTYGINFQRIDESVVLFGFLVQNTNQSAAQKKALRLYPKNRVPLAEVEKVVEIVAEYNKVAAGTIQKRKDEIIAEYRANNEYKEDFLKLLKPTIERNLAFLHDYKQFIARVKQNINVVLQERYGGDTDAMLAKATQAEGAIYWAASLMTEKLQTASLLLHPEKLSSPNSTVFRLHGSVIKYVRIYNSAFQEKQVKLDVTGFSDGEIRGDSQALGVIPQTLLDNALKYSQKGSRVTVDFRELGDFIHLEVTSFGPRIEDDEKTKIFELFYRGKNAIKEKEEGSGVGLHLAQFVAKSIGSEIFVNQKSLHTRLGYETTFSMRFAKVRKA